jgi:hypothetical protein
MMAEAALDQRLGTLLKMHEEAFLEAPHGSSDVRSLKR